MPVVISVANEKGGVGKTDLAVNLTASLAELGKKVLLIDLDPQANATRYLLEEDDDLEPTSADLLIDSVTSIRDLEIETLVEGLDLIPASKALSAVQLRLAGDPDMQFKLKRKLRLVSEHHDLIFIDTPPSLGVLTVNAMTASNFVIVPLQAHFLPLYGINDLISTIRKLKQEINPSLELLGIVLTMYDRRTRIAKEVEAMVKERFDDKLLGTKIPLCVKVAESPSRHEPVTTYAPASSAARAYNDLSMEFLKCLESYKTTLCKEI